MKIAFLFMDVTNLGDLVIRDTARYVLDDILRKNNLEDCEVVPVDIGERNYKRVQPSMPRKAVNKLATLSGKLGRKKSLFKKLPNLARGLLLWSWHHSNQGKYFNERELPKLAGTDLILFGGGGLIKYHKQSFHFILHDVTKYADAHGLPVLISAVGVEGYSDVHPGCVILKRALNRNCVKYVSSRDDYELLVNSFIENPDIVTKSVCDPAFWTVETYDAHRSPSSPKTVGLNVIRHKIWASYLYKVDIEQLDELYHGMITRLLADGYKVDLFSNGVQGDTEYIDHLLELFPDFAEDERISVSTPDSPLELVNLIASYDRYMAVRLHASIIGTVMGVPNISLVWNIKQILFGKQVGLPQNYLTIRDFDAPTAYERLMDAQPYEMDQAYKHTIYDNLEQQVLQWLRSDHAAPSSATRAGRAVASTFGAIGSDVASLAAAVGRYFQRRGRVALFALRCSNSRKTVKTQPNKIAIMTNTFRYTCNPKYIYQELVRSGKDHDIVWLVQNIENAVDYPEDARIVQYNTPEGIREVFSAKIWLDNGIAFSNKFDKKPDQIHIQTMHGSLGIKRIDNAVLSRNARGKSGQRVVRRETENTNYVITNSKFEEEVFRRVFWKNTPMVRLGHARTDVLFSQDDETISRIRNSLFERYGLPVNTKIALFAPTHRKGLTAEDIYIDYPKFKRILEEKFGGEFSIIVRLHDRTKSLELEGLDEPFVFDAGDYPDMQELMLVTDVGITDYSSWIFDYVVTARPGFHYVSDIDRYDNRTGLAYPIEESPFPYAKKFDELVKLIEDFDNDAFVARVHEFLEEKQAVDDGHSAERIVKWFDEELLA